MLRDPGEGHFWQVDHIRPVYEGGGRCTLDNLQTLCTVCHKEVSDTHICANPKLPRGGWYMGGGDSGDMHAPSWEQSGMGLLSSLPTPGSEELHSHRGKNGCSSFILWTKDGAQWVEHSLNMHEALVPSQHCTSWVC